MERVTPVLRWLGAALVTGASPAWATPGRLGGGGGVDLSITRILLSLMLCLMLAVLAAVWLKRRGGWPGWSRLGMVQKGFPTKRRIEILESRRINQYADLSLVRCGDRDYLILSSQAQQQLLRESPASDVSDVPEPPVP